MSETVLDSVSISANGGTATGNCSIGDDGYIFLEITGYDTNSTNLDVSITGGAPESNGTIRSIADPLNTTGIDASVDGSVIHFGDGWGNSSLAGLSRIEVTVTNNAGNSTTVTMAENGG